ncbi:MAG: MATE family efflux transporter [Muribaculaceae bacterium]|nr:MATE family efflux transporter [Muribaculaceae bacterium]
MHNINKEIIRLSVPTIASNITIPLLGICDTAISGHLGSEAFLSAIAVGSVMQNVVFWIFGFLRGGTTGLTANALGEKNENEIAKVFYRGMIIALLAGLLIILLQRVVFNGLWWITGTSEEIKDYVWQYFSWRVWGAPALLSVIMISGWFVGMQNTFYPMLIAISMNIINIVASFVLVFPLDMGFPGVAFGTMLSNWFGLALSLACVLWFRKGKMLKCRLKEVIKGEWWRYFSVNGNLFLRSLCIIAVTLGVTAAGGRLSLHILAVNAVMMQFFLFFSFFMDGFAFSAEAMIGLRAGERNFELLGKSASKLLQWSLGTAVIFSIIYFFASENITGLLSESQEVVESISSLWPWLTLLPIISCWSFIFDGFYIGITDTYKMMLSTLLGGILFFGVINLINIEWLPIDGNQIIWTAFLGYLFVRGAFLALMWPRSLKKYKNLNLSFT